MGFRAGLLVLMGSVLLALPIAGRAQTDPTDGAAKATAPPFDTAAPRKARRAEPPPKVIALEGDEIVGKVPKPQVFYVLGRTPSHYRTLDVRRSFVNRIVESLKRNPL